MSDHHFAPITWTGIARRLFGEIDRARSAPSLGRCMEILEGINHVMYNISTIHEWGGPRYDYQSFLFRWERLKHERPRYKDCDNCGVSWPKTFVLYSATEGVYYCPHCVYHYAHGYDWLDRSCSYHEPENDYDEDDSGLLDFSCSPLDYCPGGFQLLPTEQHKAGTRFFGCEIEFICGDGHQLHELIERHQRTIGIFKYDGSIPFPGGEFCTLPMTRAWAEKIDGPLTRVLTDFVQLGARAWHRPGCGLHIHVSRDSASWLTWGKVERFFLNTRNQPFLTQIAGRSANGYCQRYGVDPSLVPVKQARDKARMGSDRYTALNFQTGKSTVEFRLFRGNVAPLGVIRAIQFCDALVNWASTQSARSTMEAEDFKAWVLKNGKAYPRLVRQITGRARNFDNSSTEETAA